MNYQKKLWTANYRLNMSKYYLLFTLSIALFACENAAVKPNNKTVVVEAYLQVNQPVRNIRLTEIIPLGNATNAPLPINDAKVFIDYNNQQFQLTASAGDSGYYHYAGTDLPVEAGKTYELNIEYKGETISAVTTAPALPQQLAIATQTLSIAPILSVFDVGNRYTEDTEITWNNPEEVYHYLLIESSETTPVPIDKRGILNGDGLFGGTAPIRGNKTNLTGAFLRYYGNHKVTLFRVNQEYVDLYNSSTQDSRNLNEPLTNIVNGLGIFTCVSADTTSFVVKRP